MDLKAGFVIKLIELLLNIAFVIVSLYSLCLPTTSPENFFLPLNSATNQKFYNVPCEISRYLPYFSRKTLIFCIK